MKKAVLGNGLTVLYYPKKVNSVVVEVMINVGSCHEKSDERGISHFLEHILFEGTKKRPTNKEISNEIERIGGDFNAYTSTGKTCFYAKVLKKHFTIAVDVLADILQNPLLREEDIKKEKNVVLKEIAMIYDEPRFHQWILLQQNLFEKHPCKYPTYGDVKVIKTLNRIKVEAFFRRYYVPNNMVVSIVGDVPNWRKEIEKNFVFKRNKIVRTEFSEEPALRKNKKVWLKKKIFNTHLVLGFKTVSRAHADSYVLDVINGILGRGQSGKMFTEIRSKRGLGYDVGTQVMSDNNFGYFAAYAIIDKKNIDLVKNLMLEEIQSLQNVTAEEVKEAQDFIEGDYLLEMEDTQKVADQMLFWEQVKSVEEMNEYLRKVKKVTINDIKRVVGKYFNHYAQVVLEGK
ncbi:insulinase family protein [Candidatus Woesearchaeota archaeon]|nr:insulinase family protein [Candidatus Woesearchaeota archaeon]